MPVWTHDVHTLYISRAFTFKSIGLSRTDSRLSVNPSSPEGELFPMVAQRGVGGSPQFKPPVDEKNLVERDFAKRDNVFFD
jgi:hypothetical protein